MLPSLRLLRFELAYAPAGEPSEPASQPAKSALYLRDILLWIVVSALVFAEARFFEYELILETWRLVFFASQGLCYSLVALCALWVALGPGPVWLRLTAIGVFAPASGVLFDLILEAYWETMVWFGLQSGLQGALLAGALWIFRAHGYRLRRATSVTRSGCL